MVQSRQIINANDAGIKRDICTVLTHLSMATSRIGFVMDDVNVSCLYCPSVDPGAVQVDNAGFDHVRFSYRL